MRRSPAASTRRPGPWLVATAVVLALSGCVAGSHTTRSTFGATSSSASGTPTTRLPVEGASLAGSTPDPNAQPIPTGEGVPGDELAQQIRTQVAAKGSVRMSMSTVAGAGEARVDTRTRAAQVSVTTGGRTVTLVTLGGRTWVKGAGTVEVALPAPTSTAAGAPPARPRTDTRHWLLLDPGGADAISRALGTQAQAASQVDPGRFTTMLPGLLGDRTPRGEGTQTAFSVPPTQYLDAVGAPAALRSAVTRQVRLVVVQDRQGVLTSVVATVPTARGEIVDRTEYSRWGEPAEIEEPPSDDVAPAPGSPVAQDRSTTAPTGSSTPGGLASASSGDAPGPEASPSTDSPATTGSPTTGPAPR
ncbi:hypothetical protein [Arsenicicoccus dermatophilus]|uniref:hypothetical protein n=1 Tax=Arsenicicoccus dermatophilus TaxID=1076331 RepID=UPI001F4D0831|nr:hypothetical protein [Arsenicicoccus dermatophilus]MCH8613795.1 hypothetical protein [Arsenicicoccus dermatophilus]